MVSDYLLWIGLGYVFIILTRLINMIYLLRTMTHINRVTISALLLLASQLIMVVGFSKMENFNESDSAGGTDTQNQLTVEQDLTRFRMHQLAFLLACVS